MALLRDTFREALARKIFLGLFGFSTVLILFFLFIMKIDVVEGAIATISLFGKEAPAAEVTQVVRGAYAAVSAFLYGVGLFLAVFASAGLIPSIFEPGRVELLLSKPVSRAHLLTGRYLGNLAVIAANILFLVLGIWTIFGAKTGIWGPEFLYATLITVFAYAALLTIVLFTAVVTESAVFATVTTFAVMIISMIVGQKFMLERLLTAEWARNVVRVLYAVLPKIFDLGDMNHKLVSGLTIDNWMPVWSTALFAGVMFTAALVAFAKRNY